jgi:NAD-dependent SIR2 family protein deacetylase
MRTIRRTEITVETRQSLVIHRHGALIESRCAHCAAPAVLIRLEDVARTGISLQAICQQAEANRLHLVQLAEGLNYICLNSLLK